MDFFPHRDISAPSETIPRVGASQQVFMDVCSMVHVPCSSQTTWTLIFHVYMFHVSIILRFPYFICIVAAPAHSSCCALDPKLFDGFSWWTSNIQCWPFARSPFFNNELVGGWPTPLKNDGVKVSWDDDMTPILMEVKKAMFQSTNQSWVYWWHVTGHFKAWSHWWVGVGFIKRWRLLSINRGNMTGTPLNNDLAGDFAIAKRPPSNPIVLAG